MNRKPNHGSVKLDDIGRDDRGSASIHPRGVFLESPDEQIETFFSLLYRVPSPHREEVFVRFCLSKGQ